MLSVNNPICMELHVFPVWLNRRRDYFVDGVGGRSREHSRVGRPPSPPLDLPEGVDWTVLRRRRTGNFLIHFCTCKVHMYGIHWKEEEETWSQKSRQNRSLFQLIQLWIISIFSLLLSLLHKVKRLLLLCFTVINK